MIYYSDGSSTIGVKSAYCVTNQEGKVLERVDTLSSSGDGIREFTNNEEEYRGVIAALKLASRGDTILTDSKLVYHQVRGDWKITKLHLLPLCREAAELCHNKGITIEWINRELNVAGKVFEKIY